MAGSASNDCGAGRSVDSMSEWRSSEQLESGTPSTSPPYWDTDDEDDCGLKPSDLYGKFTWKIENFSQITKRELRSNDFEVGGYKWYILIYPQGCDVCNHLSLFLCVANHDKLLPGWSHFAQFTIAVVNLDPKKSKYSDTLHRFWKKEHDWGWKKFMELSKVLDGFLVKDTLIIKAQVQVIREKADRPFRCLDCQYRRELVRVYLSNVEQICRRFLEERRSKLIRLIEDKIRWSSFCSFWLGIDQKVRHCMSSDKSDVILKVIVKHFFIEKEVTSTLVMDSLYSGLKALENQSRNQKFVKLLETEEIPAPIIHLNNDMFVLADDVLVLLERASVEPLPPKDDKGPQNRTKDGNSGENTNRDSIERDERRLTELGRRTVETFVLAHIFSNKIEVAYQEAVALKRQEELIREEEVAGQAESVLKAKRAIAEKEKKAKKKQAKQKRYNRKGKDKRKDEKSNLVLQEKHQRKDEPTQRIFDEFAVKKTLSVLKKAESLEDTSDVSDIGDDPTLSNFEERDPFPVLSDTDASEVNPSVELGGLEMSHLPGLNNPTNKNTSIPEDSCSTCSTDSIPSISTNGVHSENLLPSNEDQTSSYCWGRNKHSQVAHGLTGSDVEDRFNANHSHAAANRCKIGSTTGVIGFPLSLKDQMKGLEQDAVEKQEIMSLEKKLILDESDKKGQPSEQRIADGSPSLVNHQPKQPSNQRPKQPASKPISSKETSPIGSQKSIPKERSLRTPSIEKPYLQQLAAPSKSKHPAATKNLLQLPLTERSSAPLAIIPKPIAPVISSSTPSALKLSKPVCEVGVYPSSINHEYVPQSYRNVIMGKTSGLGLNFSPSFSSSTSDHLLFHCQDSFLDTISVRPELQHNVHQWIDCPTNEMNSSLVTFDSATDPQLACKVPGTSQDETFPHLDIINDLLNDEHCLSQDIEAILDKSNSSPLTLMDMGQGSPYKDEVHSIYGFSEQFHQLRDFAPQMMSSIYMTDQIGDVISNQWILGGADLSLYNTGNLNHDKYQIFPQEYTNVACGVNGYPTLWGSSGH